MFDSSTTLRTGRARAATALALLLALTLGTTLLAGCGSPAESSGTGSTPVTTTTPVKAVGNFPITITDDASRTVTIKSAPARIVSLAPANTEILYSLGVFDRVVGVTTYDDYPAQVKDIAKVGDFTTPNLEAIAAAKPDVVLVTGGVQADTLSKLESLGVPVVVIDPQTLVGVYDAIAKVSEIAGVPDKGLEVVGKMKADFAAIKAKIGNAPAVPAFIEIGWNPLFTAGPGTLLDDLLTQAGGRNVVTQKGYVSYSVEQLVKDQPQVYLGTLSSIGDAKALAKRSGYSAVAAVKNGRVFSLTDDLVSRPGPRVIEGVREMAAALHPDLFK